ncbi:MAG: toxin-antitoxin system HicB family antitoxin [Verrucomicrobia bacterium]|nr:toxin-antitoxin system HicB family antitoxin [Verrucomicrobiota bacterium]
MKTIAVRIPDGLARKVEELTASEETSVDQFVSSAVAERMSVWLTLDSLKDRAQRGNREEYLKALAKVPRVPPAPEDAIG